MGNIGNQADGSDQWINVAEAARIMGVTEIWVLRRLHDGTLPGFKINARAWCVEKAAVLRDVDEYREKTRGRTRAVGRPRSRT